MVIMGLDMAGHKTGVAVIKTSQDHAAPQVQELLTLKSDKWLDMTAAIIDEIDEQASGYLSAGHEFRIALEDTYYGGNAATVKMLNRIGGAVISRINHVRLDYKVLAIAEIDTLCNLHYRKGQRKTATMTFAKMLYTGEIKQDEADAVCVAYAAERLWYREDLAKAQENDKEDR